MFQSIDFFKELATNIPTDSIWYPIEPLPSEGDKNPLILKSFKKDLKEIKKYSTLYVIDSLENFFLEQNNIEHKKFIEPIKKDEAFIPTEPIQESICYCFDPLYFLTKKDCSLLSEYSNHIPIHYYGLKEIKRKEDYEKFSILTQSTSIQIVSYPIYNIQEVLKNSFYILTFNSVYFPFVAYFAVLHKKIPFLFSPNRFFSWLPPELHNPSIDRIKNVITEFDSFLTLIEQYYNNYYSIHFNA